MTDRGTGAGGRAAVPVPALPTRPRQFPPSMSAANGPQSPTSAPVSPHRHQHQQQQQTSPQGQPSPQSPTSSVLRRSPSTSTPTPSTSLSPKLKTPPVPSAATIASAMAHTTPRPEPLLATLRRQDTKAAESLISAMREMTEVKKKISAFSKRNFQLESQIAALDLKIALLIKNRISLEDVLDAKGAIMSDLSREKCSVTVLGDRCLTELYGRLFHLLQRYTVYISRLARLIRLAEMDNFLQTVMFTLYANQYEEDEEHLLLTMFRAVLKEEFKEAKSVSDVLRGNTTLTRMMSTYTRRSPGQQYLKVALGDTLTRLTDERSPASQSLEINPVKVFEQWVNDTESKEGRAYTGERKLPPEACAAIPAVKEIIAPRMARLEQIAAELVSNLVRSLPQVPYGVRWICRQIKQLVKERWPDATFAQVCSVIGGFFILRFVNPAIATPNAYMLVDAKLSATARRNLTLVAKVQQNLSNNLPFGGVKEFYMAPLNSTIAKHCPILNSLLDRLTEVDDLDEHLSLDQYLVLTKIGDQSITISLNEIYSIHSLLIQFKDQVFADLPQDDEVRELLGVLPAPPAQLSRKDNSNVELHLLAAPPQSLSLSSSGSPASGSTALTRSMRPEQIYGETKWLFFDLIKAIPSNATGITDTADVKQLLGQIASWSASNGRHDLLNDISRIVTNLKKLVAVGFLPEEDSCGRLRRDIGDEITNIPTKLQRVTGDAERLKAVLRTLSDRYDFGLQQLKVYEEYLANVRSCSAAGTAGSSSSRKGKGSDSGVSGSSVSKSQGPFKFTHAQLEKDSVIVESHIPEERRYHIIFQISMPSVGTFEVTVMYRSREISTMRIQLDDLLEKQANNDPHLDTDFLKLNVNLLIFLLNKHFMK